MTNSPLKNVIEWAIQFVYQIRWVDTRKYFIKGPVNYSHGSSDILVHLSLTSLYVFLVVGYFEDISIFSV